MLFGEPRGDWRDTPEEAREDARRAGEGHRERWAVTVYLSPGVTIQERDV